MKKFLSFLMVLFVLFAFIGCAVGKVYEADAAEFSTDGMTITLTEAFIESSYEGYTACYDSSEVAVFVLKESFSLQEGMDDMSLDDYAALVYQSNAARSPEPISKEDGLTSMEYEFHNEQEDLTYKYFSVMFKGLDAFWLVQFACEKSIYDEYKPYFIDWAKTVDVSSAA